MNSDNTKNNYAVPKRCEECGSQNVMIRVCWAAGQVRTFCPDCGGGRAIPKVENLSKRTCTTLSHWASNVKFKNPRCTICGETDRAKLVAHHIIPVSHDPENKYKYKPSNGITLCEKCHFLVHNKIEAEVSE